LKSPRIHQFEINGEKLVFDVESDTLHQVDDLAWKVMSLLDAGYPVGRIKEILADEYFTQDITETLEEINYLQQQDLLWGSPLETTGTSESMVKALCLNIAHTCNLSCRYCFAGEGSYGGEDSLMSPEVGKVAIDFLLDNSGGRKRLEVDYFGGEPLLNFETVKETTAYARQRARETGVEFGFTLTTNGLLLTEDVINYLQAEGFSVILSLDGRKEVHDRMRRSPGGDPSYEKVKERLLNFLARWNGNYYVRGTFTSYNLDFSKDVAHMVDLGFRNISLEPAVSSPEDDWALSQKDLPYLEKEYERLAEYYLQKLHEKDPFDFFHFAVDLDRGPCVYKRLSGCGAGNEYLAVTPTGELYPCHQLVGDESLCLGNVRQLPNFIPPSSEAFPPAGPLHGKCASCWARYHCGGGCRAAARLVNGSFHQPYELECALQKKRLECALYIKSKINEKSTTC